MRVSLVSLHYAEYSSRLALALSTHHEVLLCLNADNAQYELSTALRSSVLDRLDVRWLGHPRRRSLPFHTAKLAMAIRRFRPNVLHVQEERSWVPAWTNKLLGNSIPLVLTVHDPLPHSGSVFRETQLRAQADRVIVHGRILQEEWRSRDPYIGARLASVPHGTLGGCECSARVISETTPRFLFFGRIEPYKGLGVLLQASDLLAERGFRFRLIVAGTGSDLNQYVAHIREVPWGELIDRRIHADGLPELFGQASTVVLPYTDATQSGVAAMAFGFGLPVIATRVGGLPDTVRDEYNGLLIPPNDVNALTEAMSRVIASKSLREQLAYGARASAAKELSWDSIAWQTFTVYESAVRAHGRRSSYFVGLRDCR
jgi:glycosyltransferase involved in cell wall biosynthesis